MDAGFLVAVSFIGCVFITSFLVFFVAVTIFVFLSVTIEDG